MKTKHTQGEWIKSTSSMDNHNTIWITCNQQPVCGIKRFNQGVEQIKQAEANAKLIASAPDLLEALQIALFKITEIEGARDLKGTEISIKFLCQEAIKKATE